MKHYPGIAGLVLGLCLTFTVQSAELHVPGGYPTIQAAMDAAVTDDVITVANGTYSGEGNRDLNFDGKAITVRSAKGPEKCIINCGGSETEPHRGFIFENGKSIDSVVDGFTITNGYANDPYPEGAGGAIYIDGSGPTIQNCVIHGNIAQGEYSGGGGIVCYDGDPVIRNCTITDNQSEGYGGGILCERADAVIENCAITDNLVTGDYYNYSNGGGIACWDASPTVTGCTIQDNVARYGGGIVGYNESSPQVNDCVIRNNHATNRGGGVYIDYSTGVRFLQCTIRNNSADSSGGGLFFANSDPNVISCTVLENTATQHGGGIYTSQCNVTMQNCQIDQNEAETGMGGGFLLEYSDSVLENLVIMNNFAAEDAGGFKFYEQDGPATLSMKKCNITGNQAGGSGGGGVVAGPNASEIDNSLFAGNTTLYNGGGLFVETIPLTLRNCTISGNRGETNYGGGVACWEGSDVTMINTIVWGNVADWGEQISLRGISYPVSLDTSNCCIEEGDSGVDLTGDTIVDWGIGNITSEPNFVSPGYWDVNDTPELEDDIWVIGDFHLLPGSDCIDAGNPNNIDPNEVDLAGNDRFLGGQIDMGAYENEPVDITVSKMTVKAGKTREQQADSFNISGTFAAAVESFAAADTVSLCAGAWSETLRTADFQPAGKGMKYIYKGPVGGIISMSLDFIKGIFTASGKELSLTGTTAPAPVALVMGDYYGFAIAEDTGDDDVINAKKSLPIQLLSGHTDTLEVTKPIKIKPSSEDTVASLTIQGNFSSIETVDLTATGLTIHWGDDSYTLDGNKYFTEKSTGKYVGKKKTFAVDTVIASVTMDFVKCTFKIVLKKTDLTWQESPVTFGLEFGSFNRQDDISFE